MDYISTLVKVLIGDCLAGLMFLLITLNVLAAATVTEQIDDLRIHYLTLKKAQADFIQAQNGGKLSAAEKDDYIAWINQLRNQVLQDCGALQNSGEAGIPEDLPCAQIRSSGLTPATLNLAAERTKAEQTNGLITELNSSLGEFDERLLQEQDRVKAQTPRTESGRGSSSSGSASTEAVGAQGRESASDKKRGNETEDQDQTARSTATDGEEGQNTRSRTATQGKSMPGSGDDIPDDIPNGSDDDVVARQLREAAEKETDPELKKKLWEEYRRYKAGTS